MPPAAKGAEPLSYVARCQAEALPYCFISHVQSAENSALWIFCQKMSLYQEARYLLWRKIVTFLFVPTAHSTVRYLVALRNLEYAP